MDSFERVLLRFKEQVGLQTDKEVAALLGLSATAFGDRKKRNAFPEDKLRALAQQRPELNIDVLYVLTGDRELHDRETQEEFVNRIQAINHMNAVVAALPLNELGRKRLQILMTGNPTEDGRLIGDALMNRDAIERPQAGFVQAQTQSQQSATVTPLHASDRRVSTRDEVLALVLDTLHEFGRTLPSDKMFQVVDLLMTWQRAGAELSPENVRAQLKMVS